jgi:hypothetical protein
MEAGLNNVVKCMVSETGAESIEEIKRLLASVVKTSEEFPDYFFDHPRGKMETYKREIFVLSAKIKYFDTYVSQTCLDRLKQDLFDARIRLSIASTKVNTFARENSLERHDHESDFRKE